jgi:SAM-dependent methyltransferase
MSNAGRGGPRAPGSPPVPSFRTLDFERLWSGRERVTEVERAVVHELLGCGAGARTLEIGPGGGRLSLSIQEHAREYVAADVTPEFLLRVPWKDGVSSLRLAANVYHLPFVDGAFSAVVMVRVYGFLADPSLGLGEIARVLAPGGIAIVSYNPRPSVATLVDDLKTALGRRAGVRMQSMTFTRSPVVQVRPSEFPAWSSTRGHFRVTGTAVGMEAVHEFPTGLEEYRGLRWIPTRFFLRLAHAFPSVGGFPTRFAALLRSGSSGGTLPAWAEILACPACSTPFGASAVRSDNARSCSRCCRLWPSSNGILDLRWDGVDTDDPHPTQH